jgi:hypothetical protein
MYRLQEQLYKNLYKGLLVAAHIRKVPAAKVEVASAPLATAKVAQKLATAPKPVSNGVFASGNGWTAKVTFAGASRSLGNFTNRQDAQDAYGKEAMLAERDAHIRSSGGPGIHRPCAQKPSTGTKRERKEKGEKGHVTEG